MPVYCVILSLGRGKKKDYDDLTDYLVRQTELCLTTSKWRSRPGRQRSARVATRPYVGHGFRVGVHGGQSSPHQVVDNVWLIKAEKNAREVRELFRPFLDFDDFICVIPVAEHQGWFARMGDAPKQHETIDWLLSNLGIDY